ncbi:site-specific DNA-methyltransferase [Rothia dentocariosa]|jgi:adenine specific DNA methylase mod|uniref:site-specific DNA-methyltransferase n=1 Tax=Rothia dentocariosa TaxID=2047 RepID=UPI0001E06DFD|nr:DNA (cytosine-5-)-methyltransferase [Rothia dentocariosa M567]QKI10204.1 site-specific DNA-methyltransferase [Rothia dentocariosa]
MPELNWVGKDKVITHHLDVPYRVLDRQYSYDEHGQHQEDNGSQNMIIHGDNLEALKALLPRYEGKVDCVYIDPPYNTGNEGWVYNDAVNDPRIKKWLGEVVGKEGEDLSRHDKWLCMMYPRLRLLQRLLAPTGAIFVSIDDNEAAHLKAMCDEIFGARCFVADISWQRTYSTRNDSKGIPAEVEHLFVFSKQPGWNPNKLERTAEMDDKYSNPDGDRTAWTSSDAFAPGAATHQGMVYAIQHPFTGELVYPARGRCWTFEQAEVLRILSGWTDYELRDLDDADERARVCGVATDEVKPGVLGIVLAKPLDQARADAQAVYERGQWPRFYFTKGGQGGVRRKTYLDSVGGALPTNFWSYEVAGHTDEAKKEIRAIFDGRVAFDTPKPTRLIERILAVATDENSLVLDSFAGSGTTAHALLNLNKADGGNRRFILVELGDYAGSVTAERVRRTITGYKDVREEQVVLFDHKLTLATLKKGADLVAEATTVYQEALDQDYSKVSRPKVVTQVSGKSATASVQVVATRIHNHDVSGTGGDFSFYELGPALLVDGLINPDIDVSKVREYVWFTETGQAFSSSSSAHPYFLGRYDDASFFFVFEPDRVTSLDRDYLASIPPECAASSYVIYADTCLLSDEELRSLNITFKKIPRDITRL